MTRAANILLVFACALTVSALPKQPQQPYLPLNIIQSTTFYSPYDSQEVSIAGIITAVKPKIGFYVQLPLEEWDSDMRTSEAIFVFDHNAKNNPSIGDMVSLTGRVKEYYGNTPKDQLSLTQITDVTEFRISSHGVDRLSALCKSSSKRSTLEGLTHTQTIQELCNRSKKIPKLTIDDSMGGMDLYKLYKSLSVPPVVFNTCPSKHQCYIQPTETIFDANPYKYPSTSAVIQKSQEISMTNGLGFWESLEHMIVIIPSPRVIAVNDRFGSFFVVSHNGSMATGLSKEFTLVSSYNADTDVVDTNPERIMIGRPLNATNIQVQTGDYLDHIVGIVDYYFGQPRIIPLSQPQILQAFGARESPISAITQARKKSVAQKCPLHVATYNVENLYNQATRFELLAKHIIENLHSPDIIALQEVMDNDGPKNSEVVDADRVLNALVAVIKKVGGPKYAWSSISPIHPNSDGGKPGGNIRQAFLYNPSNVKLSQSTNNRIGAPDESIDFNTDGVPSVNPGRIDPTNKGFSRSRKPLVAVFDVSCGGKADVERLWAINLHLSSKMASSPQYGQLQPPKNGGLEGRNNQIGIVSEFVKLLLEKDEKVMVLGDMNENEYVHPLRTFTNSKSDGGLGMVETIVEYVHPSERYSYIFGGNGEQLDHIFVSSGIREGIESEIVHLNTYIKRGKSMSDHDPVVTLLNLRPTAEVVDGRDGKRVKDFNAHGGFRLLRSKTLETLSDDEGITMDLNESDRSNGRVVGHKRRKHSARTRDGLSGHSNNVKAGLQTLRVKRPYLKRNDQLWY